MATYSTVQEIVTRLTRLSGQVPGVGIQTYGADIFVDMINVAVSTVCRKYWWPHLMDWMTVQLDGSTGVPTTDLTGVRDHTDIKAIYYDNYPKPLAYTTDSVNPTRYSGTVPLGYEALPISHPQYATRLIRIIPVESTGSLKLRVRLMPATLGVNDTVPMDADLIVFGVLWSYFEDEGDNPQQAGKYKNLFDSKFTELIAATATHRIPLDSDARSGGGIYITGDSVLTDGNLTGEYDGI